MKINFFKPSLLLFFFLIALTNTHAQKGYLKVSTGYQFAINGNIGFNYTMVDNGSGSIKYTYDRTQIKWASGLQGGLAFGYRLNKTIGLELGVNYLRGATSTIFNKQEIVNYGNSLVENSYTTRMAFISPTFLVHYPFEKLSPYAKFGLVFGLGNYTIIQTDVSTINANNKSIYRENKVSGGLAFGYQAGIGLEYQVSKQLSFFGECNLQSVRYEPSQAEVVKYTIDGNDAINSLSARARKTIYEDKYVVDSSQPISNDAPNQSLSVGLPFDNIGISVGLLFAF